MKSFKIFLAAVLVFTNSIGFSKTTSEEALAAQTANLQRQTVATAILANYLANKYSTENFPTMSPVTETVVTSLKYTQKAIYVSLGILVGVGAFMSVASSFPKFFDKTKSFIKWDQEGLTALSLSFAPEVGSSYLGPSASSAKGSLIFTENESTAALLEQLKQSHELDAQLANALDPWFTILNLNENESAKIKNAIKTELITNYMNNVKSGSKENSLSVDILTVAERNGLLDREMLNSIKEVIQIAVDGKNNRTIVFKDLAKKNIAFAEELVRQLSAVEGAHALNENDQAKLSVSVKKLNADLQTAKSILKLYDESLR